VIGAREAALGEVSIRLRGGHQLPSMVVVEALAKVNDQVAKHSPELWAD
jgi:threonyl-tRNA synthetase